MLPKLRNREPVGNEPQKPPIRDRLRDSFASELVALSFVGAGLSFWAIIGWQTFTWLESGAWPELPLVTLFKFFEADLSFIYNPSDWYGIAKIAQWVLDLPLSVCIPLLILLTGGFIHTAFDLD